MIKFPRLKTFLSVFPLSETTWGLRGGADEMWRMKLTDERAIRAFGALLPYLNGKTSAEEILRKLEAEGIHGGAAGAVLRQLETSTLIEEADACGLPEEALERFSGQICFFSRFTQQGGAKFQAALHDSRVALLADGVLGESVYQRLANAGFGDVTLLTKRPEQAQAWAANLTGARPRTTVVAFDVDTVWPAADLELPRILVVCQERHDPVLLEAVDALSKRRQLPWLLVRYIDLQEGWVGPLFVPGETASYLSLEARLRSNMPRFPEYLAFDAHVRATEPPPAVGGLRAGFDLLANIAVIELIKFTTEIKVPELLGKFLSVNFWNWETELHEVLRLPALDREAAVHPSVFPWKVTSHDDGATSPGRA